ncbi:MAG TPA: hypothetical protein PK626_00475 [Bacteroidales bacterium]|nr:hypothetical protein [Bacteroidales bacterium]
MELQSFFGTSGLSSTSANSIANYAKEAYREIDSFFENLQLYNVETQLIGTSDRLITKRGLSDLSSIKNKIEFLYEAKALITWLHKAIKAKEDLEIEAKCIPPYKNPVPQSTLVHPKEPNTLVEADFWKKQPIKTRYSYLYLETKCAVIGGLIHENGAISKARKKLLSIISNPSEIKGEGRDTIITYYTPSVSVQEVDKLFFELQGLHRSAQAELNSLRSQAKAWCDKTNIENLAEYKTALTDYYAKKRALDKEKEEAEKLYYSSKKEESLNSLKEINSLKIVIPDNLREIYEAVNSLTK